MVATSNTFRTAEQRMEGRPLSEIEDICRTAPQQWTSDDIAAVCVLAQRKPIATIVDSVVLVQIARCRRVPIQSRDRALELLNGRFGDVKHVPGLVINRFVKGWLKRHPKKKQTQA